METGDMELQYLAKKLASVCESCGEKGVCPIFYSCPAPKMGWTCGNVSPEEWASVAEDFVSDNKFQKMNRLFPDGFIKGKYELPSWLGKSEIERDYTIPLS